MFTRTDESKKTFVEKTRLERQKRERERLDQQILLKQTQAVLILQRWWRRQSQVAPIWSYWDSEYNVTTTTLLDAYSIVGQYCFFSRRQAPGSIRLAKICRILTTKYTHNSVQLPFYTLLTDKRYQQNTRRYIEVIMNQCLQHICTSNVGDQQQLYLTGPELTTLLYYLNPTSYKPIQQQLDSEYTIGRLPDTALCILQSTLKIFFDDNNHGGMLREACMTRVERLVKLEKRFKQRSKPLDKEGNKMANGIKLWLTTVTRICLFPLEHASDSSWMNWAATHFWTSILTVPLLTQLVSSMVFDLLQRWALGAIHPFISSSNKSNSSSTMVTLVGGNGYLFLMANLVDLYKDKMMDQHDIAYQLMNTVIHLVSLASPFYSDRQRQPYSHYHPIFKWSRSPWGDTLDAAVFELVIQDQLTTLWSRQFMDQLLEPILKFQVTSSSSTTISPTTTMTTTSSTTKSNKIMMNTKNFLPVKKKNGQNVSKIVTKDMAEFSINTQLIFSMYSQLGNMFTQQKKIILARIAFTPGLMSQLWTVMNHFGPQGNMVIYLDAARKSAADLEKEPLIDVLRVFCEACSLVFLTLDDIDIFQNETPFSLIDLQALGRFLNTFYFALVQQPSKIVDATDHSNNILQSHMAAKRLLLQLYDLDNRRRFCPPDHWLLVSDPMISKQSLLRFLFSSSSSKDDSPEASQFLTQVRQGDMVSTRILQLMPHTIPFKTRLHIFRDWIQLDRSTITRHASHAVTIRRQHVLEDGLRALSRLPSEVLKGVIRVSFVNELGIEEAGIDQGGPFKDFVTLLVSEVFKPEYGLFSCTTETNLFYPATTSSLFGSNHLQLFEFIGKMIGKAIYEGILLDCQFAGFILSKILGRNVFLEALQELDEDVWRNLIFLKHYEGDVEDLGLTFATDERSLDTVVTRELKYHGQQITVTNENKLEYVYLMADFKLNQQAREQTRAFIQGFRSIISAGWIKVFAPPELQRVISGEDMDFDVPDLRRHTQYQNGYFDQHPIIKLLWQIVQDFPSNEKRAFLKFVTSCPKPPLGGFSYLQPPFTIRMVSTNEQSIEGMGLVRAMLKLNTGADKSGRLPSSSTCFNLLKLPAYTKKSLLREKLCYAIHSNTGFELS
ncbi:uncharacterized protein BX664DRAFT_322764 [Halteromyces radiatus]|uniref:uncharacterized protein n=1 Tax=Halteromyces radiatus TaxID=101107 RepID=UPI00222065F3|nr:uncharacterized protein BX664DRAFT_322764 [Halteromyces radiatus]KAI8100057.1 hypothetical protein BX664DRAFT_322764 [Halteromyces radiatus]